MGKTFNFDSTQQDMQGEEGISDSSSTSGASPYQGQNLVPRGPHQRAVATPALVQQSSFQGIDRVQWSIVEPFNQNLSHSTRSYLDHFNRTICADMVAFDGLWNPLRDLIPATQAFPYLLHIIIANAAHHVLNRSDPFARSEVLLQPTSDGQALAKRQAHTQRYYHDALVAKNKALLSLAQAIEVVTEANFDWLLSAILLFINYDLIESGRDQWEVHMDGAQRLVSFLGRSSRPQQMSRVRIYQLSEYLNFYILGSTFRKSYSPQLFPPTLDVAPILEYTETHGYLSCPAPLLSLMLESFELSNLRDLEGDLSIDQEMKLRSLVERTLAFDPAVWLLTFKPASEEDNLEQRFHMASAHRSAVCIYLARFIPYDHPLLNPSSGQAIMNLTSLASDIVQHVAHITPNDTFFKALNWPLFLAGAETDDPLERAFIMHTLDAIYDVMRWGYVLTNRRFLETIWAHKGHNDGCWVTEITKNGTKLLIV